ncbi:unnamed protein product [Peniophora sp. CBMAI 1063]|nr:unnamed protein product [Peniophora sp. CBMAI 1063]
MLLSGTFDILKKDNEENGVTACRAIQDIVRTCRIFTDEIAREDIFSQQLAHLPQMINETHMAPPDPRALPPAMRSFRVLSEMGIVIVTFAQTIGSIQSTPRFAGLMPLLQGIVPRMYEATCLEAPAQREARAEFEAMGGFWSPYDTQRCCIYGLHHGTDQDGLISCIHHANALGDIPATALSSRRDHMVVLRHLLTLPQRKAILSHIDKLLDENVLLGRNASTRETLRATAFAAIADLVHHFRNELTMTQLAHGIHVFSRLFHNPALSNGMHTLAGKMLFGLFDTIVSKESRDEAVRIITLLLEVSVDRLETAVAILPEVLKRIELRKKGEDDNTLFHVVEAARPIAPAVYATERPEEVLGGIRLLIRTLVPGLRVCFSSLKKVEDTVVDGTLVTRLFNGFISALTFYEPETRESQELMEWLAQAFYDMDAHVVQQVWTRRMDFFQCARKRPGLVHLPQLLYGKEHVSPTLVAVVLEYLVDHLTQLGDSMIALPSINEPVFAHFLPRLIMDSFSCAAHSNKAVNYYHLLRALFRAVGGGQGRFELLYQRIHPLLPEILENLNAQLMVSDGFARDLLQYLMKPLALSLKGPTDLVNQGLRTLELFIDNLTPGCLDPTLNTVLRELTDALHDLLRPLPANHQHSHTALRILGKLGGRNRHLLDLEPEMDCRHYAAPAAVLVSMGRDLETINLTQPSILAARSLRKGGTGSHIPHAYAFLENCAALLVADRARGRNREEVLERALEGIFDALKIESLKEQASDFIKQVSASLFALELRRLSTQAADPRTPPYASPVFTGLTNAIVYGFTLNRGGEANESATLVAAVIADFVAAARTASADTVPTFRFLSRRLTALAVEDGWARKRACVIGIQILLDTPNAELRWLDEREAEIARTLFHILKDMTGESESNIELVTNLLQRIVRLAIRPIPAGEPMPDRPKPAQV